MKHTFIWKLSIIITLIAVWVVLYGSSRVHAQETFICDQVIQQLEQALNACQELNNTPWNWACYGNYNADVAPVEYRFQGTSDRRPLSVLDVINTDKAGIVVMNLLLEGAANPVKAILFGPIKLTPSSTMTQTVFTIEGDNPEICTATPSGIALHVDSDETGQVVVNGATITLGSTAFITIQRNGVMIIFNIEGRVAVTIGNITQILRPGQQIRLLTQPGVPPQFLDPEPTDDSPYVASQALEWLGGENGLGRIHNYNQNPIAAQACIKPIKFGEPLENEELVNPGHECLYQFCTDQLENFTVRMDAVDPGLNPWVDLRAEDGSLVAYNNDTAGQNTNSLLCNVGLPKGCYTIVARSSHNESAGHFRMSLDKQTSCTPPVPACEVVNHLGQNVRKGPGFQYPVIETLAQSTYLQPVAFNETSDWIPVKVGGDSGVAGYINSDPHLVECEIPTIRSLPLFPPPSFPEEIQTEPVSNSTSASPPAPPQSSSLCIGLNPGPSCVALPITDQQCPNKPGCPEPPKIDKPCKKCGPFPGP